MLRITLLGGLRASGAESGEAATFQTRKVRALLAYLACPPGRAHPRDKLAALLWGECSDSQAHTSLRQALYGLRKALARVEPRALQATKGTVALAATSVEVDVVRFEHLIGDGTPAALEAAVALYQGELLEGLPIDAPGFEEWLIAERERLRERAIEAMARLFAHQRSAGALEAAVQTGIRLLALEPVQESVHRAVIRLQLSLGRRGAALRQYRTCIETLQRELGIEAEPETKLLYQEILRAVPEPVKSIEIDARSQPAPVETPVHVRSPAENPHIARTLARMPFVGRREELERLMQKLGAARSGTGGLAFLVGEPGIGKTRLLEEFTARAGARVLSGRCFEAEFARPFGPFAEAISSYAQSCEAERLQEELGSFGAVVAKIVPELRDRLPNLPEPIALNPDEERFRLLDAVAQALWAFSDRAPLVLVLDDLHWADGGTVALLRYLARFLQRHPVLLVGAYRDMELDREHPLADALVALHREVGLERIALSGLPRETVTELLEMITPGEVPANFADVITVETAGNPFFMREILLYLLEEEKLNPESGRFSPPISIQLGIPQSVRAVIGRRLSRLSNAANSLLNTASGFGGMFRFDIAANAADLEEANALDALDEALEAQLLRTTGDPEAYDFAHALVRHALYGELSPARRVRLHRRLAQEMERVDGDRGEHAGEIATQWHRSLAIPGAERGVPHCIAAADAAQRAAAHEEAASFLGMALDLLPEADARRARLLARRGLALAWSLRPEEAVRVAREAGELLAVAEGANVAADYLAEAANAVFSANVSPLAWKLSTQGLLHIGDRRDFTWALLMHSDLIRRLAEDLDPLGIPSIAPEMEEIHRVALNSAEWANRAPGEIAVERLVKPHSRAEVLALPYCSAIRLASEAGEYRRALDQAAEYVARALAHGRLAAAALGCGVFARVQLALGELSAADEWQARAFGLSERVGNPPFVAAQLAAVPFERVRVRGEGFSELFPSSQALRGPPAPEYRWGYPAVLAASAYFAAEAGLHELALGFARMVLPAIERAPAWEWNYTFLVFWTVAAYWELDQGEHAGLLERNLQQKSLPCDFRHMNTDTRLGLALTCALQRRLDEAVEWFAKARLVLDAQGARPLRAITDFEEARMHVRLGADGDRERALALLEAARDPFEEIGMAGWLRRADKLQQQLER
jgi:DNA-binding SARP family transcriptional activator